MAAVRVRRDEPLNYGTMHSRLRTILAALALCITSACSSDSSITEISYENGPNGIQAGYVALLATAEGILVTNQTSRPIHLMAVERSTAALINWAPCTTGTGCAALAQGEQRLIPRNAILGSSPDRREYVVYWWHAITQADGSVRAGNITSAVVTR